MKLKWLICLLFLGAMMSCTSLKQPSFLGIDPPKVLAANSREIKVMGVVHFNNPNKASMSLKQMKIEMSSNDNLLGVFLQDTEARIEALSDFSVPFTISFSPKQLGNNLLATALSVFSERKLKVKFRGYAKIGGKKRGFKIPLIYNQVLKFK